MNVVRVLSFTGVHFTNTRKGARLVYLPAYSPDFNPIEEAFSFIKLWLRRHEFLYTGPDQIPMLVHGAIREITPDIALGWFTDCGYVA